MSVGRAGARIDAAAKLTGEARFPADRIPGDALWGLAVFTNQPHARLVSLNLEPARAAPGVVTVLGSADVPVNEYGLTMFDQPVFVGTDHTGRSPVPCDVSRWEADHLALVVAKSQAAARAAAAAIEATWEPLPVLADIDEALASDTLIHPHDGRGSNRYCSYRIRKGDMARGWAEAAVTVASVYELPYQEHAYLQPEAGLAYIDAEGRVTVEIAGQWAHEDREQIAHALDLDEDRVRVIYPPIGGAFGGREDMSLQIVLALAALRLHEMGIDRPVAARWSREESIVGHHKRHRGRIEARWGAAADGRITAVSSTAWLDAGAYNYTSNKVLGNCHLGQAGPYEAPNAEIDSHAVYTNSTPGGAFRGFGAPQAAFAAETQVNKLAEALGMDPVEIRRINSLRDGSIGITQTPLPAGVTLPAVIDRCAAEAAAGAGPPGVTGRASGETAPDPAGNGPSETTPDLSGNGPSETAPDPSGNGDTPFSPFLSLPGSPQALRRGRGFACAFKNVGFSFGFPERCEAAIVLHGDGERPDRAELYHAGAEVGQGAHTAFVQMAAEAAGVAPERIEAHWSDTATSGDSGSASASRLTFMAGNAILGAAEEAEKTWLDGARPATGHFRFVPPPTDPLDPEDGRSTPNFAYGYVAQHVEVTVDVETGHIRVDRVVSAHDVGRAVNPDLVVGQIEGGVVQGHGYALSEDLRSAGGRVLNPRLSAYLIPGIGDIPARVDSVVMEMADPIGPWGARGMAEMPLIPYAAAVVAAVHDATGVWLDALPLTPDRVLSALEAAESN